MPLPSQHYHTNIPGLSQGCPYFCKVHPTIIPLPSKHNNTSILLPSQCYYVWSLVVSHNHPTYIPLQSHYIKSSDSVCILQLSHSESHCSPKFLNKKSPTSVTRPWGKHHTQVILYLLPLSL